MTISTITANLLGNPTGLFAKFAGLIWNRRNSVMNNFVLNLLKLQPTDRVLDLGFGGGYLLDRMSMIVTKGILEGVDISPAMVTQAEKRYQKKVRDHFLNFGCASAESLPFPNEHFTIVCSINSIFYWKNAEQGIREVNRVIKPNGKVAFCLTSKKSIEKKGFAKNLHLYNSEDIVQLLTDNGFINIDFNSSDKYRQFFCVLAGKVS